MECPPGKMSQKYECNQCGSSFSKSSLLQEHRRILGHREIFFCHFCQKIFYRKDNLEAHKKKHGNGDCHECDVCHQIFSYEDSLDIHKRNCHLQIGTGFKRKSDDLEGPPVKRRITKYDDPEDSYRISVIGGQQMPKFNTTSTRYQITFKALEIRGIPNILKSLRILFNSIIKNITEYMNSSDLVRMSVQCPELDFPISLPFMRLSQLNAERFLSEIERVLQSYEQFVLDEGLEI